jgi:hypothetical protein
MLGQRRSIHVRGDQSIGVKRLLDGDAANKGRDFARHFIEPAEHDMLAGSLDSGALQDCAQARATETGRAHRSFAPLDAGYLRTIKAASVSRALKRVNYGMGFQFRELG